MSTCKDRKSLTSFLFKFLILQFALSILSSCILSQTINKEFIDQRVKGCDPSFNPDKSNLYIINGFPYQEVKSIDSLLVSWNSDSLRSITFLTPKDQWDTSIGRGTNSWIVIVIGNYDMREEKKRIYFKEIKSKYLSNLDASQYPLLLIDSVLFEGKEAKSRIKNINLKNVSNIDFETKRTFCLIGRDSKNGVVQIWTKPVR